MRSKDGREYRQALLCNSRYRILHTTDEVREMLVVCIAMGTDVCSE